jgi:hypothetical protein
MNQPAQQQSRQQLRCKKKVAKLLSESREKGDINCTHPLHVVGTVIVPVRAKKQLGPRRVVASAIRGRRAEKLATCAVREKGEREMKWGGMGGGGGGLEEGGGNSPAKPLKTLHAIMAPMLAKLSIKNMTASATDNRLMRTLRRGSRRSVAGNMCSKMRRFANVVNNCSNAREVTMPVRASVIEMQRRPHISGVAKQLKYD